MDVPEETEEWFEKMGDLLQDTVAQTTTLMSLLRL
jgi:hypothetical protein